MPSDRDRTALIAGGGIAGLAAALALADAGWSVKVLERRDVFSESGAGIQISPNGVRALQRIGVADRLSAMVGRPQAIDVRDAVSGRPLQRLPLGAWIEARHGAPYWVAHRRDLQAVLLEACRLQAAIEIIPGFEVTSVVQSGEQVVVAAVDGNQIGGAVLVGADGAFSRLRDVIAPGHAGAFTGRTAARTVIPVASVPTGTDTTVIGVWVAPGAHIVHYPVRSGRELAVVVVREDRSAFGALPMREQGGFAGSGWSTPVKWDDVAKSIDGLTPALGALLSKGTDWRRWALFEAKPLPHWAVGRLVLIGDAAHPILPFLAQGGSLGLEDAVSLPAALARRDDPVAAWREFEAMRKPRADRVVAASRRNGRIFHLSGLAAVARDTVMRAMPGERVMAGFDWVYGWRPPV